MGSALFSQATPPVAPVRPVTDDYFGTKVVDNYRWMENLEDPGMQAWMKAQADYTRKTLAGFQATEPNTWKDYIACAHYLVDDKYTSPHKLAGIAGSAGGILMGVRSRHAPTCSLRLSRLCQLPTRCASRQRPRSG